MLKLIALLLNIANASESWLCTTQASQVRGTTVMACGVGLGSSENEARSSAFSSAKAEFDRICQASPSCEPKNYAIEPKRMTCEHGADGWKCYRLLAYANISNDETGVNKVASRATPKIKKGMSKQDLVSSFGPPSSVTEDNDRVAFFYNNDNYCEYGHGCMVIFINGKAVSFPSVKSQLISGLY